MLNLSIKLQSWRYKNSLKRCVIVKDGRAVANRAAQTSNARVPPNASFVDGVATKDCIIDPGTGVSIRIFLPYHCLGTESAAPNRGFGWLPGRATINDETVDVRELSDGSSSVGSNGNSDTEKLEDVLKFAGGYYPRKDARNVKLPVIVQFHDGGFVSGSKDSSANDIFCRRIAKACKSVVVAVGYRLAPEHKFPAQRDDGLFTLKWLAKQANLASFPSSVVSHGLIGSFGQMPADPWLSAHLEFSRCVLMGIGAGGTIAEQVAQATLNMKLDLEPLKVLSQIFLYPFFSGTPLLASEVSLSDAYFMDKDTLSLAWKCFLPEGFNVSEHQVGDPVRSARTGLGKMPSTLVISAELDMLRDRGAAYVEALKKARVEATDIIYRNAVHGFATIECFVNTKQAQACVEDIAIWFAKHVRCDYWS